MKKILLTAALFIGIVASQLVGTSQAQAQEVYLGGYEADYYLLTETVTQKAVGGKMMNFSCTVKEVGKGGATKHWEYYYIFYSDGLVVYQRSCNFEKYEGKFNAVSPGAHADTIAYKAFIAILKIYGLL